MQKSMKLVLAGLVAHSAAARSGANPLGEVVSLLTDLSAKVTSEGEAEAKSFAEYSEWCDDTIKEKGFAIKTATSQQEKLEATISELSANIDASTSKVGDLAGEVAASESELKSATGIRDKETSDFKAGDSELMDVIDTLGRAITVLEREMQKNPSLAQIDTKNLANVLSTLDKVVDAAAFSATDKQRLTALVQSAQNSDDSDSELGAPAAAVYDSHSGNIVEVLEDLKEKAETQLSDLRKAETNAKHNYDMLKQSLVDQMDADNKDLDAEKQSKAASEQSKAAAEGDLSVTVADLKTTNEALTGTKVTCKQVAEDHDATVKARDEELKTIAQAIGVLKDTTSGAVSQTYSFLQESSIAGAGFRLHTRADLRRSEVVALVKKLAKQYHSAALAQLASRIGAVVRYSAGSGEDPFAKVKGLISEMIKKLQDEAGAEATEKAYCDDETSKTETKKGELDAEISKLTSKIDISAAQAGQLKEDIQELQSQLAAIAKEQAEMDSMRQTSHSDYVQAKSDLELGLSGVRKALVVLREYYAAGDAAFVQQPAKPTIFDAASGSGTSIIGILEVVESDFATNLAKEETEESTAAEAYDKMTQQNKITKTTKDQDVKYKTKEEASLKKSISELSSDRDTSSTELSAVLEYYEKLNERCIAKPETYESRKDRRQAEIAGLKDALNILESETAFVQSKRHGSHLRGAAVLSA